MQEQDQDTFEQDNREQEKQDDLNRKLSKKFSQKLIFPKFDDFLQIKTVFTQQDNEPEEAKVTEGVQESWDKGVKENYDEGVKENYGEGVKENYDEGVKENYDEGVKESRDNGSNQIYHEGANQIYDKEGGEQNYQKQSD